MASTALTNQRSDFDAAFLRGNPWRHRRAFWEHVYPKSLAVVLAKNGLIQAAKLMTAEVPPVVPWDDRVQLLRFAVSHLQWPVTKDILIASTARTIELLLVEHVYASDPLTGARFVRDIPAAAIEAHGLALRSEAQSSSPSEKSGGGGGVSLASALRARWAASVYVFVSAPYPSIVANAAYFTVEEASVIIAYLYRRGRRAAAETVLEDGGSRPDEIAKAHRDLIENEERPGSSLLHDSVELLVRSSSSVVLESLFAATGTMLMPGVGTSIFAVVGSVLCWLI